MKERPLRTTVIGSYPLPAWLELASQHLDEFGEADRAELFDDAVTAALHDQVARASTCVTDGEQTRLDFNLSFYGYLEGIDREAAPPRRFGPPGHDQRGRHAVTGELRAPRGLGVGGGVRAPQAPGARRAPRSRRACPGPTRSAVGSCRAAAIPTATP